MQTYYLVKNDTPGILTDVVAINVLLGVWFYFFKASISASNLSCLFTVSLHMHVHFCHCVL